MDWQGIYKREYLSLLHPEIELRKERLLKFASRIQFTYYSARAAKKRITEINKELKLQLGWAERIKKLPKTLRDPASKQLEETNILIRELRDWIWNIKRLTRDGRQNHSPQVPFRLNLIILFALHNADTPEKLDEIRNFFLVGTGDFARFLRKGGIVTLRYAPQISRKREQNGKQWHVQFEQDRWRAALGITGKNKQLTAKTQKLKNWIEGSFKAKRDLGRMLRELSIANNDFYSYFERLSLSGFRE